MKKQEAGQIYFHEGDSELSFKLHKSFVNGAHPVMLIDWLQDIIYEAEKEKEKQVNILRQKND